MPRMSHEAALGSAEASGADRSDQRPGVRAELAVPGSERHDA
jgi:hypothetical protein